MPKQSSPSSLGIGQTLRLARSARHLTQAQFAAASGVPLRTLIRVEAGDDNVKIGTYARAAQALGLHLATLQKHRPTLEQLDALYGGDDDGADSRLQSNLAR